MHWILLPRKFSARRAHPLCALPCCSNELWNVVPSVLSACTLCSPFAVTITLAWPAMHVQSGIAIVAIPSWPIGYVLFGIPLCSPFVTIPSPLPGQLIYLCSSFAATITLAWLSHVFFPSLLAPPSLTVFT